MLYESFFMEAMILTYSMHTVTGNNDVCYETLVLAVAQTYTHICTPIKPIKMIRLRICDYEDLFTYIKDLTADWFVFTNDGIRVSFHMTHV